MQHIGAIEVMRYIERVKDILFGFRGTLDRQAFCIGSLIVATAYLASPFAPPTVDGYAGAPTPASELWTYGLLLPLAAVAVKRVNDIGWPSWLGFAYAAIVGLSFIPWSIGVLPVRPETMSAVTSNGVKALLLVIVLGFAALAVVPGNWRPRRFGE